MRKTRQYTRLLGDWERHHLGKLYENHVHAKGFLSKAQRQRLLGIKKKERETTESDFWYNIKRYARGALLDLELICNITDDEQLKEIFEPLSDIDHLKINAMFGAAKLQEARRMYPDIKPGYGRTDFNRILRILLQSEQSPPAPTNTTRTIDKEQWKYKLAVDVVNTGLNYFTNRREFKTTLHMRLFQDLRDSIGSTYHN